MVLPPLSPTARAKEEKDHVTDETVLVKIEELRRVRKTDIGTIAKFREELEEAKTREDKLKRENEELREAYKTATNIDHEVELENSKWRALLLEAQNEHIKRNVASLENEMNTENREDMLEAEREALKHQLASLVKRKMARKKARNDEKSSIEEDRLQEFLCREEEKAAETTGMIPLDSFQKLHNAFSDIKRAFKELSEEYVEERKKRKALQKQWKQYLQDPSRTDKQNYKIRWIHLPSKTTQRFDKEDTVAVEGTAENEIRKQEEVSGYSQKTSESPHKEILDRSLPSDRPVTTEEKVSRNNDSPTSERTEKENFVPLEGKNTPSSVVETSIGSQTTEKPDSNRFDWETQGGTGNIGSFQGYVNELRKFEKEIMNDFDIHPLLHNIPDLPKFVGFVRKEYKKHMKGQSSRITLDEIKQLEDIGFKWKKRHRSRNKAKGVTKKTREASPLTKGRS